MVGFHELFKPQPIGLYQQNFGSHQQSFPQFMIRCRETRSVNCDLKVWNESCFRDLDQRELVECMKIFLASTVNSYVRSHGTCEQTDVQDAVSEMVNEAVYGSKRTWSATSKKEEEYDVTLAVPYTIADKRFQILMSMKW
jgi:hypothetical protein